MAMKKNKKSKKNKKTKTLKSTEVYVSQHMLYEVRDELKSDIASLSLKMDSRFSKVDARFNEMESRFSEIDARLNRVDSRLDDVLSEVQSQNAKFHRMLTLYEEQETRNRFVLDGYTSLNDRLENLGQ